MLASVGGALLVPLQAQAATFDPQKGAVTNQGPNAGDTCTGNFSVGSIIGTSADFQIAGNDRDRLEYALSGAGGTVYFESFTSVLVGTPIDLSVFGVLPNEGPSFPITVTVYESDSNGRGAALGSVEFGPEDLPSCTFRNATNESSTTAFDGTGELIPGGHFPLSGTGCFVSLTARLEGIFTDDGNGQESFLLTSVDAAGTETTNQLGLSPSGFAQRNINTNLNLAAGTQAPITVTLKDLISDGSGGLVEGATLATINLAEDDLPNCTFATVTNQAPTASAGADKTDIPVGTSVTLDGSASTDPDDDALTYSWVQTSGPAVTLDDASGAMPSFTIPDDAAGATFTFDLLVNDGTINSVADSVTITVLNNTAPVADAGADQGPVAPGDEITLTGSASSDADGDTLTYSWVQTGGTAVTLDDATAESPIFTVLDDTFGEAITFDLIVNDGIESSVADSVTVTVRANAAPLADAGMDQGPVLPGDTITLNGNASSDADGDALTYSWVQTGGTSVVLDDPSAASPSFTVPDDSFGDAITFDLIVSDGFVTSTADSVTVNVRTNAAPVADAGSDLSNVIPGSEVTLDGSASSDADGDAITYSWTQVSGPAVTIVGANTATPSFTAPAESGGAPVVLQLIVNDGFVSSEPDTVRIAVIDNVAAAQQAIGDFMAQRANLLLANQPDLQRRIDRLEGRSSAGKGSSIAGLPIPGSDRLPAQITVANGFATASANVTLDDGSRSSGAGGSWDIWAEAYIQSFGYSGKDGDATIIYSGIDVALNDNLLVGVMGQYDDIGFDKSVTTGVLSGEGWMVGPYATARLAPDLFLDARAAFGSSNNTISPFGTYTDEFDADRTLLSATLTGQLKPSDSFTIRPELAVRWFKEESEEYVDGLGSTVGSVETELGQISLAPRAMYEAEIGEGWVLRPFVEARGIISWGDARDRVLDQNFRLRTEGGFDLVSDGGFRASISGFHDGIGTDSYSATGVHVTLGITF